MMFDEFINKWSGKGIDFDGAYGDQCMDLMHQYCVEVLGLTDGRILAAPAAKDVWFTDVFGKDKFDAIPNTPTGVPQKGDIMLFGTEVGQYGHVSLFVSGDANSFVSFDQNWSGHQYCEKITHHYGGQNGVLGWLRFKPANLDQQKRQDNAIYNSTQYDLVTAMLGLSKQDDLGKDASFEEVKRKFDELHSTITGLENANKTLNDKIVGMAEVIKQDAVDDSDCHTQLLDTQHQRDALYQTIKNTAQSLLVDPDEQKIISAITSLKQPHEEVVKQYNTLAKAFEDSALYKRAPKKAKGVIDKILSYFK